MNKKLNYILLMIVVLIMSLLTVTVNAEDLSFTTTMTPSSTTVSESTEVTITVSVSNLNVGDDGINAFSAYLAYDSDVFETLTSSSVEGLNSWSSTYSTSTGRIALVKNSFVNETQEIMQITLKTKEGVEEGTSGTVSLTGIVVTNSEDEIDGSDISTTITVGTGTTTLIETNTTNNTNTNVIQIETNSNTSNNTANNTTNNATNNTNTTNNATNNTNTINNVSNDSDDDIPYTGTDSNSIAKIILGVIFIALVIYIKIRRLEDVK